VLRRLFALDHNFPQPMLAAMVDAVPQVELVPVRDIDPDVLRSRRLGAPARAAS
jgi:hypothetical protein